jgi:hypothetical protein
MEQIQTGNELIDYVRKHTAVMQGTPPEGSMVIADTMFIKVAIDRTEGEPNKDELAALIKANKGEFCEINLFDGAEHSYIEIGGWIGDQTDALLLMGLGTLLGLFKLLTPNNLMPFLPQAMRDQMAGMGMVSVIASSPE